MPGLFVFSVIIPRAKVQLCKDPVIVFLCDGGQHRQKILPKREAILLEITDSIYILNL
jgi:hypothetical protein